MLENNYPSFFISEQKAEEIAFEIYGIRGKATPQAGELDANFKLTTAENTHFILKISRPLRDDNYFDFQQQLLLHMARKKPDFRFPQLIKTLKGETHSEFIDASNQPRKVRLLAWISGRLWSAVNPQLDDLRFSLGQKCGAITNVLSDFKHEFAKRDFEWDIAQMGWTNNYFHLFDAEQKACLSHFKNQFDAFKTDYNTRRKSVIHNDANDNNIVVNDDLTDPSVLAIIDYGDAIYTQTINDLAVTLAYAIMEQPDPLAAALPLIAGYHAHFPLEEAELSMLYTLVGARLAISVTKSAINKIKEPNNAYLVISEKPAWDLLHKWREIPAALAHFSFRNACGFTPVPTENAFNNWALNQQLNVKDLFPSVAFNQLIKLDLSVGSLFLGNHSEYKNTHIFTNKINELQFENEDKLIAGGYLEPRPLYSTDAFKIEGNSGYEYRTIHLGVDFWQKENTPVHALFDGEVVDFSYNGADKDYGGVLILKHKYDKRGVFYTLYGHLSKRSIGNLTLGKKIKKGKKMAELGAPSENGNWTPHLHFQIMLDLLDYKNDFPGVGLPSTINVWSSICPDPNLLFEDGNLIEIKNNTSSTNNYKSSTNNYESSTNNYESSTKNSELFAKNSVELAVEHTELFAKNDNELFEKNRSKLTTNNYESSTNHYESSTKNNELIVENGTKQVELSKRDLINLTIKNHTDLIHYRKQHLGKSLSISYAKPLKILRGERQYLIDDLGQRYLDTVNNVAHVGHEHPKIVRAGQQQMAILNTNTRYLHDNILDFARELLATLPKELSVLHFVNSGSEANELALRMATAVTHQKDVIALEVGYHGNTSGCVAVSSYKFDGKGGKGKPENTHIVPLPDSFRGKYQGDKSETGALYAAHVSEAIEGIKSTGRNVSAFLAESIVSCGGQIDLPDNYLSLAYAAVRKEGGVCIADEVQVGFGRVGKYFWGFELQNVVPDIVTMGKPIGNGHPLAAVACTEAVALAFANGMEFFNTFGGNPVSCAIGLEVLRVIKAEKLQENAFLIGELIKNALKELQKEFPLIGDVRGEGLFLGFELVEKNKVPATDKTAYLANRMKAHGILISVDGPQNNVIKIKPPMCFDAENAGDLMRYLRKILKEDFMQ